MGLRIAHLADVHFKSLARHDEMKEVFEAFAADAAGQGVDHIFVGGDVWHAKLHNISPEFIDLFVWWLDRLSQVAPVHIILGNHDGNVANKDRQDALSPLIRAVNNPRVHLYKQSGVYNFAPGYNWCVFSIFDEDNWDSVKPVPGDTNIACYHGPVRGAMTELEWEIDEGITAEFFREKGFTYCFLGDIHKHQWIDLRDAEIVIDEADLAKFPTAKIIERLNE